MKIVVSIHIFLKLNSTWKKKVPVIRQYWGNSNISVISVVFNLCDNFVWIDNTLNSENFLRGKRLESFHRQLMYLGLDWLPVAKRNLHVNTLMACLPSSHVWLAFTKPWWTANEDKSSHFLQIFDSILRRSLKISSTSTRTVCVKWRYERTWTYCD